MVTAGLPAIDRLIVIAGPPSSGKTTLIDVMRAGGNIELLKQLDVGDPASWSYTTARELEQGRTPYTPQIVIHFDIWSKQNARKLFHLSFPDDERLTLLGRAREITFVTLWTPPSVIVRRMLKRTVRGLALLVYPSMARQWIRNHARIVYRMTKWVETYQSWFSFCESFHPKARWIADSSNGPVRLRPQSDWAALTGWREHGAGVAGAVTEASRASPDQS